MNTNGQNLQNSNLVVDYFGYLDWNIGSLFSHENETLQLLDICNKYSIPHNIKYAFGSPHCTLQAGRVSSMDINLPTAKFILDKNLERGLRCRLTFSRPDVTEEILEDKFSNELLEYLNNNGSNNGVVICNDKVLHHVKENYPKLQTIASITKTAIEVGFGENKDTIKYYSNLLNSYDLVVVNASKIYEKGFLESLPNKEKVEFIVHTHCIKNCPRAKAHYLRISEREHNNNIIAHSTNNSILKQCEDYIKEHPFDTSALTKEQIKYLVSLGYKHFKIPGRTQNKYLFINKILSYVLNGDLFSNVLKIIGL